MLIGFDAAVDFQPDWGNLPSCEIPLKDKLLTKLMQHLCLGNGVYKKHLVSDYRVYANNMMHMPRPKYKLLPGVTPGWDNSPRRKAGAIIFKESEPEIYGKWLRYAVSESLQHFEGGERLVFINAWNEWAESNHLEPDLKWGLRYLEETRKAIRG